MKKAFTLFATPQHANLLLKKTLLPILQIAGAASLFAVAFQSLPLVQAQSVATSPAPNQCILAGRLDGDAQWAPRFKNLELLDIDGKVIQARVATHQSAKDLMATVKQVRVKAPALLSTCNGNQAIRKGDDQASLSHTEAPAVSAGTALIAVEAISYPPLGLGGEWVELKLALQQERVTMISSRRSKP